ncbi:MAG: ABC transporter ATP-binding protein [Gemmatimonadaceae bacterium]|nr:ABC transporter ATP-binding protein [Gemmatimonadaceae bacterium]
MSTPTDALASAPVVLDATGVTRSYVDNSGAVLTVLADVSLQVRRGEMVAIVGASGSGKSTLLHVLGALDRPTSGGVAIAGASLGGLSDPELTELRNTTVGFVFQFHHLLREFSALENVMMPMRIGGVAPRAARTRAEELLALVGLSARLHHRPSELSGGEQQRTAVARALAMRPAVLLADEPSGNLDAQNAEALHDLLSRVARDEQTATVVVTHNASLAARADRILHLADGTLRGSDEATGMMPDAVR